MSTDATRPAADGQEEIMRLLAEASRLYDQGKYYDGIDLAADACERAVQSFSEDPLAVVYSQNVLAVGYTRTARYQQAEPLYCQALEICKRIVGKEHPLTSTTLSNLARLYQAMGKPTEAQRLFLETLELRRKVLGENHVDYGHSLANLADFYESQGNYVAAEPLLRQAIQVFRRALTDGDPTAGKLSSSLDCFYRRMNSKIKDLYDQGQFQTALGLATQAWELVKENLTQEHNEYATALNLLGVLYQVTGNFQAAEPMLREGVELAQHKGDPTSALSNLAALYSASGRYCEAQSLFTYVLELDQRRVGKEHPQYATTLNNLAAVAETTGDYNSAEALLRESLTIRSSALGPNHQDVGEIANNLGVLFLTQGRYSEADFFLRQALQVLRASLGEDHPRVADSLNNLASLYTSMGDYLGAEPLLCEVVRIFGKALSEDSPRLATSLANLGAIQANIGNLDLALQLSFRAAETYRRGLGEQHPEFAKSLNGLANLYRAMGNYAAAEGMYQRSMEALRASLGEYHPDFARCVSDLARLYREIGDYEVADRMFQQCRDTLCASLGEQHADFAESLSDLAVLYAALGRADDALNLVGKAAAIHDRSLAQIFSVGSESHRRAFVVKVQADVDTVLSLVRKHFTESSGAVRIAMDIVLRRKSICAEALAVQRDTVLTEKYPRLKRRLRQLAALRAQLTQRTLACWVPKASQENQALLATWNEEKERLEADLARQIPEMNLEQKLAAADRRAIALHLAEGTALVEFVRFNEFDFQAVAKPVSENQWRPPQPWKPARYLAFVLPAGEPDNVKMIDLGEAEPIDRMIADFRAGITGEGRGLGAASGEGTASLDERGAKLRQALFDPLRQALRDRKRVLLSPDGDLTRLAFEVLPTERGRRLIDDYHFSYVAVGRDVLRFGKESTGEPAAAVVVGDPDFDLGSGPNPSPHPAPPPAEGVKTGRHSRDLDRSSLRFDRLAGTRTESEHIARFLDAELWLDSTALEARLKACRSPRILHLATHGFFLEDQKHDPNADPRGLGAMGSFAGGEMGRLSAAGLENPLLRSGLALAGVNTWLQNGTVPEEAEDGLLTAEDVTGMDLLDTELVVLSACETGLGEVQIGEGVMGLRRSFVLAGAKTLVMSLWKVPDEQTQELMVDFYNRILKGEGRADALRQAQLAMKAKYPDPLYWGAFICQGEPSPLPQSPVRGAGTQVNT